MTPTPENTPTPTPTTVPTLPPAREFRVLAYVTDAAIPAVIPYDKLTHINYAFLIPNEDGTFVPILNSWMVGDMIARAHENKVKVLVSVGGWGWDAQFEKMAADPGLRETFIRNLMKVVDDNKFDGVDIDWEYPDPGDSAQNFLKLMQALRTALPDGKLLTAAVAALGQNAEGYPTESFALMDFVNLMAYDNSGAQHSSLQFAQESLQYWLERGLPAEKAVLGVPFYGRGTNAWATELSYGKIVRSDPTAPQKDSTEANGVIFNYNGIATIQAKTRLALEKGSGIMFWTLEGDAPGDASLLSAIHAVVVNESK